MRKVLMLCIGAALAVCGSEAQAQCYNCATPAYSSGYNCANCCPPSRTRWLGQRGQRVGLIGRRASYTSCPSDNCCGTPAYASTGYAAPVYSAQVYSASGCSTCGTSSYNPVAYSAPLQSNCNSCGGNWNAPVSYAAAVSSGDCGSCGTFTSYPNMGYGGSIGYPMQGCGGCGSHGHVYGGIYYSGQVYGGQIMSGGCGDCVGGALMTPGVVMPEGAMPGMPAEATPTPEGAEPQPSGEPITPAGEEVKPPTPDEDT